MATSKIKKKLPYVSQYDAGQPLTDCKLLQGNIGSLQNFIDLDFNDGNNHIIIRISQGSGIEMFVNDSVVWRK